MIFSLKTYTMLVNLGDLLMDDAFFAICATLIILVAVLMFVIVFNRLCRGIRERNRQIRIIENDLDEDEDSKIGTKKCGYCGCEMPGNATKCSSCGAPLKK